MRGGGEPANLISRLLPSALIAVLGVAIFILVLQVSVAGVFRSTRPELALRMAPFDARARAELASRLVASAPASTRQSALALALDAVRREPLQPQALRVIAETGAEARSSTLDEAALMFQAERLSRRDYLTQIWLIRHFLERNDIGSAMRHFDIALRSAPRARPTIFALLTETASIPAFRAELDRTLAKKSVWAEEFGQYLVANGSDFEWAAQTAFLLFDPRDMDDRQHFQTLLNRMSDARHYDLAWSVYRRLAPAQPVTVQPGLVDGFALSSALTPFDWNLSQDADLWASPEKGDDGRTMLRVAAYNGKSGNVARRLLRLPAGSYRISVRMGDLPNDRQERPELTVSCATGGLDDPLVTLRDEAASGQGALLQARFTVTANCRFQWITVHASGLESSLATEPWLGDFRITPIKS